MATAYKPTEPTKDQGDCASRTGALVSDQAPTGLDPSGFDPAIAGPSQADYDVAERANTAWGQAINGPHVSVLAAQMARREGYLEGLAAAAAIAKAHKPDRIIKGKSLGGYDPEDRDIIRAEENGEAIAAHCIAAAIAKAGAA